MTAPRFLAFVVVPAIWAAPLSCLAESPPCAEEIRSAVAKSLPFLEKEGVAWMRDPVVPQVELLCV